MKVWCLATGKLPQLSEERRTRYPKGSEAHIGLATRYPRTGLIRPKQWRQNKNSEACSAC